MPSPNCKRKKIFKLGSSIDKKIESVKTRKVTNAGTSEELNFWFIYYFKNFGTRKLVS